MHWCQHTHNNSTYKFVDYLIRIYEFVYLCACFVGRDEGELQRNENGFTPREDTGYVRMPQLFVWRVYLGVGFDGTYRGALLRCWRDNER